MFKREIRRPAPEALTDEQLEVVSGGLLAGPPWESPGETTPTPVTGRPGPSI
jgi:hypothetical protein